MPVTYCFHPLGNIFQKDAFKYVVFILCESMVSTSESIIVHENYDYRICQQELYLVAPSAFHGVPPKLIVAILPISAPASKACCIFRFL